MARKKLGRFWKLGSGDDGGALGVANAIPSGGLRGERENKLVVWEGAGSCWNARNEAGERKRRGMGVVFVVEQALLPWIFHHHGLLCYLPAGRKPKTSLRASPTQEDGIPVGTAVSLDVQGPPSPNTRLPGAPKETHLARTAARDYIKRPVYSGWV